jgi:hypothetical protein
VDQKAAAAARVRGTLLRLALVLLVAAALITAGFLQADIWRSVALGGGALAAIWLLKSAARLKFITRELKRRGVSTILLAAIAVVLMVVCYGLLPLAMYGIGWLARTMLGG